MCYIVVYLHYLNEKCQYFNTIQLIFDIALLLVRAKLRSALSCLGGADAIVMQSIVGEELPQGPYLVARVGFEPATLRTADIEPYH